MNYMKGYYFNNLASTVYSGLNNIYTLTAMGNKMVLDSYLFIFLATVNTVSAVLWSIYHLLSKKTQNDFTSVPLSIYIMGAMFTSISLWPYMTNAALRQFNIKIIRNKINDLFWNPKNQKSKQKSNSNVSIPKKNQRKRVNFSERNLNGRVECMDMIAKNFPTLPDVQN